MNTIFSTCSSKIPLTAMNVNIQFTSLLPNKLLSYYSDVRKKEDSTDSLLHFSSSDHFTCKNSCNHITAVVWKWIYGVSNKTVFRKAQLFWHQNIKLWPLSVKVISPDGDRFPSQTLYFSRFPYHNTDLSSSVYSPPNPANLANTKHCYQLGYIDGH